jgi:hypothetical protein
MDRMDESSANAAGDQSPVEQDKPGEEVAVDPGGAVGGGQRREGERPEGDAGAPAREQQGEGV